ncbi:MAG: ABC transporter substrate-binding protein [Oligoflexales bacterium]
MISKRSLIAAAYLFVSPVAALAGEVEVMHWWTSGGESKAVGELKQIMKKSGHSWKDAKVTGGGGDNSMSALKQRAVAGDPPAAVQIKGPAIQEWGAMGHLSEIDEIAKKENWDKLLPKEVSKVMKYKNKYVAAPVNVHRVNWVWGNTKVFKKVGIKPPKTMAELWVAADKLKAKGVLPFAHGGQSWQDSTAFELIALGVGGPEFFKKAFIELDEKALGGATMVKVFDNVRMYSTYLDPNRKGLDWDKATKMVIEGKAGMQFMGDWAKGEFLVNKLSPEKDFFCFAAPGTDNAYIFNIDSFAFFKVKGAEKRKAQLSLAQNIMGKDFQKIFNLYKGSIPARNGVDDPKFDTCAKKSMADFQNTTLVPSMAHHMSSSPEARSAIYEVVEKHLNSKMSSKDAAKRLASAVEEASL